LSHSTSTIPAVIDWTRLSDEAAWTMVNIAWPMSCGVSRRELAARVGETAGWVAKQLDRLADELERQALSR
jgi:hypothetical protein